MAVSVNHWACGSWLMAAWLVIIAHLLRPTRTHSQRDLGALAEAFRQTGCAVHVCLCNSFPEQYLQVREVEAKQCICYAKPLMLSLGQSADCRKQSLQMQMTK